MVLSRRPVFWQSSLPGNQVLEHIDHVDLVQRAVRVVDPYCQCHVADFSVHRLYQLLYLLLRVSTGEFVRGVIEDRAEDRVVTLEAGSIDVI